ncbi:MoaD/ThiS family protein [Candidatus Woesearchaeota archaeon]|nr:MoaD/ThiS family protein [Candidatus Woesearchaeota archaeon]
MELRIINERDQTTQDIAFAGKTVFELLTSLNINPETVLVVRNKEVITEDEAVRDQDVLEILSVISGG